MEDRVGDVLAQRLALHDRAAAGVAVSLLLHGGLTALAVWAALHHTEIQTPRTIDIRLAPLSRAGAPAAATVSAAAPAPQAAPKPSKLEKPAPPVEIKKEPPAKPEKNTVPLSPFGRSNKKGSEHATPSVATAPAAATAPGITTGAAIPSGGTGVTGLEGGDFPYTIYIDRMRALIGNHWIWMQGGARPTTTLYFVIDRDGTVRDARIETPSGNGAYDRAALRAILESSPLPPLPFAYSGTYLGVHLTFR